MCEQSATPSSSDMYNNMYNNMYDNMYNNIYTVHCTLYTVHCTLYTVRCTLYTVHCTLYTVHCTLYTVHFTMYNVQCTMYNVQCTMYRGVALIRRATCSSFCSTKFFAMLLFARVWDVFWHVKKVCFAKNALVFFIINGPNRWDCKYKWTCALSHTKTQEHDVAPSIHAL